MNPEVSVIMAFYNDQNYISQSIQSILEQRFEDWELIIINDASDDNSRNIINRFLKKRIKVIDNEKKLGLTKCLNIAINQSQGKYIARMDADDIANPERLEKQVALLRAHPEIGLVGTSFYEIDENDTILGEIHLPKRDEQIRNKIFRFNPFFHSSVMIPRDVFKNVGLYDENFYYAQDYELWFRILVKYQGANLSDLLMKRRKHKETLTQKELHLQSHFAYYAWRRGKELLHPSLINQLWILKYYLMFKMPPKLVLLISKLRPYHLKRLFLGYYTRKFIRDYDHSKHIFS